MTSFEDRRRTPRRQGRPDAQAFASQPWTAHICVTKPTFTAVSSWHEASIGASRLNSLTATGSDSHTGAVGTPSIGGSAAALGAARSRRAVPESTFRKAGFELSSLKLSANFALT